MCHSTCSQYKLTNHNELNIYRDSFKLGKQEKFWEAQAFEGVCLCDFLNPKEGLIMD